MDLNLRQFSGTPALSATIAMSRAAVFGSTSCSFICPAEPGAVLSAAVTESVETVLSASSLFCFRLIYLTIRKTIKASSNKTATNAPYPKIADKVRSAGGISEKSIVFISSFFV